MSRHNNMPMDTTNNIKEVLLYGKKYLKARGIDSYSIDAELLLCELTQFTRVELYTRERFLISEEVFDQYMTILEKRAKNMPVQYIINTCEFMSLAFYVDRHVLIPRPDTEILVETVMAHIHGKKDLAVLDMCTGSGCIAVSLCHYCETIKVTAVDISKEALGVARKNAESNSVLGRMELIESDLFESLAETDAFDILVSNPPYIKNADMETLLPNVKDYEPRNALDGGADGLDFYRKIASRGKAYIKPGGMIFFEIGCNQAEEVKEILQENNFFNIKVLQDYNNLDRVIFGEKILI